MAAAAAIVLFTLLLPSKATTVPGDPVLVEERFLGNFQKASTVITDPRGQIYVLDEGTDLLRRFSRDGKESIVGGRGWDGSSFDRPSGIATDGINLYVSDFGNHRISRFDRTLTFTSALTTRDTSLPSARFGYPLDVALSRQGDLFVLDGENLRVVKFDVQSRFERSFGDREIPRGKVRDPRRIIVSQGDRVHVLESDRILEFDFAGNFIRELASWSASAAVGFTEWKGGFVVSTVDTLLWFSREGKLVTRLSVRNIVSSQPLTPVTDVTIAEDKILILTSSRLGIFRIVH